ncbi:WXG100 family type VII secretion target [Bacillus changyiensis]|uniref:WXG100 family type VII secretion target n=1 Tax=Bacillus changyiensis TaxID=3004103 RepID=UPI0022E3310A|nr:WXG100 family type VII secretion target [Bacillus changyiensis]MDA1476268.1 WXG100 family type VII secretion target [Bacillus changyiensis]
MSGIIRVTPAELRSMAGRYAKESEAVHSQVEQRLDQMIKQLEDMWEGESSRAFAAQYQELRPSFIKMADLLSDVSKQLSQTATTLENTDKDIASQIRG